MIWRRLRLAAHLAVYALRHGHAPHSRDARLWQARFELLADRPVYAPLDRDTQARLRRNLVAAMDTDAEARP